MPLSPAQVARRWFQEIWNERNPEVIYELMAPDALGHMMSRQIVGPADFHEAWKGLTTLFPDLHVEVEDVVEQGEHAVLRWRLTGHHRGLALGLTPTGTRIELHGMTWFHCRDGRAIEGWDGWDESGLMNRLQAAVAALPVAAAVA